MIGAVSLSHNFSVVAKYKIYEQNLNIDNIFGLSLCSFDIKIYVLIHSTQCICTGLSLSLSLSRYDV